MKYIQKFRTIGFYKMLDGEEYYHFTSINNNKMALIYRSKEDRFFLLAHGRKEIEVRPEAKEQLLSARMEFIKILWGILKNDGTFCLAKGERYALAYRRERKKDLGGETYLYDQEERNDFYRFLLFLGEGIVRQYLCTVEDLLDRFDFTMLLEKCFLCGKNIAAIREGTFPLLRSAETHDRYLWCSLKYLAGIATQAEADEATSIDGKTRFVPEEKVYGEGVVVSDVEQVRPSFFARSERYSCTVTIGSRKWFATWWPVRQELLIGQYTHQVDACIKISDGLYESLRKQAVKKYGATD